LASGIDRDERLVGSLNPGKKWLVSAEQEARWALGAVKKRTTS
jgi:hypothetical protein